MGIGPAIEAASRSSQPSEPTENQFAETVNEFWFLCIVAANKLDRGEIWVAARYLNCSLAGLFERVLAWHADTIGGATTSWHRGRFIENWAAPPFPTVLGRLLAPADRHAIRGSLTAMAEAFEVASSQLAGSHHFRFPVVDTSLARRRLAADG
jgi:hypothetical protein